VAVEGPVAYTTLVVPAVLMAWVAWARGRTSVRVTVVPTCWNHRAPPVPKGDGTWTQGTKDAGTGETT
jgi:hypothetical protein